MSISALPPAAQTLVKQGRNASAVGNHKQALGAYLEAFVMVPDNVTIQRELVDVLSCTGGYQLPQAVTDHLASSALTSKLNIQSLATVVSNQLDGSHHAHAAAELLENTPPGQLNCTTSAGILGPILQDKLLLLVLDRATSISPVIERLVTAIRPHAMAALMSPEDPTGLWPNFAEALAAMANQCFNTEYVFAVTPRELTEATDLMARLQEQARIGKPESCVGLALYFPLLQALQELGEDALRQVDAAVPGWPHWAQRIWEVQAREPFAEAQIMQSLPQYTPIEDGLSTDIADQYEAFPYPRWQTIATADAPIPLKSLLEQHLPHVAKPGLPDGPVDILFAGAGTGKQVVQMGKSISAKNMLALDLSGRSLAYTHRKAMEYAMDNVHVGRADILKLGELDVSFDLIVCTGVLHHMADPLKALRSLMALAKPSTAFFLALYSERARSHVLAARNMIAEAQFPDTLDGIRIFRDMARGLDADHPAYPVTQNREFYSASGLHDLVFNRHELRFTPLEVGALLEKAGLTFGGFHLARAEHRELYRARFPDDAAMTNLGNWDSLEEETPGLFSNMMQFWCFQSPEVKTE